MSGAEWWQAECARLRADLAAVRRAVRMLDGARAAIDAHGQRVLRSLAGEERAALLEELAAARRERDDWNARATAIEAERDEALADGYAERARCAAVCREVAAFYDAPDVGSVVAMACADEIERECVSALLRTPGA